MKFYLCQPDAISLHANQCYPPLKYPIPPKTTKLNLAGRISHKINDHNAKNQTHTHSHPFYKLSTRILVSFVV